MAEREDWSYPTPTSPHEAPLPGAALVPVEARELSPSQLVREMEAWPLAPGQASQPVSDPLAGLRPDQIEMARTAAEMILTDCPDVEHFAAAFDTMSTGLQSKVFNVMANSPHLRGLNLLDKIERTLTLTESAEAERWLKNLSPVHKSWLRGY